MVVIGKKKYESGEGAQFLTRKSALKKLQVSLNEFRRLCILKGIYPREPRNRKRAQKGKPGIRILYHKKDIQFLMHEPIIWKLRDYKIFNKKVSKARALRDFATLKRYLKNHPTLKLDHIVQERYPTFIDALRDLDDCLTLCFLFSTFPSMPHVPRDQSNLCRRLTVEFMNAVIAGKALRKVFISIKGYYFQAELKGQTITWLIPHVFSFEPQTKGEVDFKMMSTFVEFYVMMLGFVNYRLYHSLNMCYPPKLNISAPTEKSLVDEEAFISERICALNVPLVPLNATSQNEEEEDVDLDNFADETDTEKVEAAKLEADKIKRLKTLFKGLKFFINREVPREPLVFTIRCFGGLISWDKQHFVGSTFDEDDESITHQIVDRPSMTKQFMSRYYIQPQWIFDSVNARELLPVEKYFMGAVLPPHLSPFTDSRRDQTYIPPEERALMDPDYKLNYGNDEEDEEEEEEDAEVEKEESEEVSEEEEEEKVEVERTSDKEKIRNQKKKEMKVKSGEVYRPVPWEQAKQDKHDFHLREKMIPKKHRKLYRSMKKGQEERKKEIWLLCKKRRRHEAEEKEKKKKKKREEKVSV